MVMTKATLKKSWKFGIYLLSTSHLLSLSLSTSVCVYISIWTLNFHRRLLRLDVLKSLLKDI